MRTRCCSAARPVAVNPMGQLADALLFALRYPKSRQLILRRTFPELEHSIIFTSLQFYPKRAASYRAAAHTWEFLNGSRVEFGCCAAEKDVLRYQGAEYDVIRFDELTHFTEAQYTYLHSRVRGVNPFPKQVKSSTNPGGPGHAWVKERFIDGRRPGSCAGMKRRAVPGYSSPRWYRTMFFSCARTGGISGGWNSCRRRRKKPCSTGNGIFLTVRCSRNGEMTRRENRPGSGPRDRAL